MSTFITSQLLIAPSELGLTISPMQPTNDVLYRIISTIRVRLFPALGFTQYNSNPSRHRNGDNIKHIFMYFCIVKRSVKSTLSNRSYYSFYFIIYQSKSPSYVMTLNNTFSHFLLSSRSLSIFIIIIML